MNQTSNSPRSVASKNRMQPLVALRALKKLINNPERTEEVFVIIKAMSGDALERTYKKFQQTPMGQTILAEERSLLTTLMDREALREYAPGSLGREYLNFVESQNITADGLVEASDVEDKVSDPAFKRFAERMRDQHDLWHVVNGYGRDTFGEACLLAFTYAQTRNRGLGIIALVGTYKISKDIGNGVRTAVWQAYKAGKKAAWLPQQDWESLLSQPLEEVRQQLVLTPPATYREVIHNYQLANA
ncbi:MAG: ubiquinone biosynthesis protein COQ4 [Candidatus Azotimanducaceae bacterium]|jgi:ubiquinone biosynthesis protein COQ4